MNVIKLYQDGKQYQKNCPIEKYLIKSLPEINIINYLSIAHYCIPFLIIFLFVWQYYLNANFSLITITAILLFSTPFQCIIWLGKRANSPLPLNYLSWYNYVKQQLVKEDLVKLDEQSKRITFNELIMLINLAKQHFGSYFAESNDKIQE